MTRFNSFYFNLVGNKVMIYPVNCLRGQVDNSHGKARLIWLKSNTIHGSKFSFHTFKRANNTDADQNARMHWLVCTFDVRMP